MGFSSQLPSFSLTFLKCSSFEVRDGMGALAEWSLVKHPLRGLCSCLGTTAIQYISSWMTEAAAEHTLLENPFLYTEKTLFCKFGIKGSQK
jgi:hypothetical protein